MDGAEHPLQVGRHEAGVCLPHSPRCSCRPSCANSLHSFVSRVNPKLNDKHVILGVVGWKPRDFANQMNLSLSNGWGIVRTIADMCLKRDDGDEGKFVLVKDPNKSILRLYEVPSSSFDEEEEEDEPEEEAGEDAEE